MARRLLLLSALTLFPKLSVSSGRSSALKKLAIRWLPADVGNDGDGCLGTDAEKVLPRPAQTGKQKHQAG